MIRKIKRLARKNSIVRRVYDIFRTNKHTYHPYFTRPTDYSKYCLSCQIAYTKYGGFCVPVSSRQRPAAQAILKGTIYEPETIDFMINNSSGKDIIHAGTYFGDFLPALSKAIPNNTVWAFEPNEENYSCARITCIINRLENVIIKNAAIGQSNSKKFLKVKSGEIYLGGASKIIDGQEASEDARPQDLEKVSVFAIDEVIPKDRKIGIIQLDVEGYEKNALQGALETIKRELPIIILENVPEKWMEEIYSLGYLYVKSVHGNAIFQHDSAV